MTKAPTFTESRVEFNRNTAIYIVESKGRLNCYRSAIDANNEFPGAFDLPDAESDDCEE